MYNKLGTDGKDLKVANGQPTDRLFAYEPDAEDAVRGWLNDQDTPCLEISGETFEAESFCWAFVPPDMPRESINIPVQKTVN